MMERAAFEVLWTLGDAEWERARKHRAEHPPQSNYDARGLAFYYLLNGNFDLRVDAAYVYKNEGGPVNISLLDFADFAASVLAGGFTDTFVEYEQRDDDRKIRFDLAASTVQISASDSRSTLRVSREELLAGLKNFLTSLALAIEREAPSLFDWSTVQPISAYRHL